MPEAITLDLQCSGCGRSARIECAGWHPDKPKVETTYTCPHCQAENKIGLPGRITAVLKGHA